MKMINLSSCGLDCAACGVGAENGCPGCFECKGKPFWGECDLYFCALGKGHNNCGKCGEFPCGMLKEWASSEGSERIENLRYAEDNI